MPRFQSDGKSPVPRDVLIIAFRYHAIAGGVSLMKRRTTPSALTAVSRRRFTIKIVFILTLCGLKVFVGGFLLPVFC